MPLPHDSKTASQGIDALESLANIALDGYERLLTLNLQATRAMLGETLAYREALAATRDLHETLALNATFCRPLLDEALSYWRRMNEISSHAQEQFAGVSEVQRAEIDKSIVAFINGFPGSSPQRTNLAVLTVKSAVAAAESALAAAQTLAQPLLEVTEAGAAALTRITASTGGGAARRSDEAPGTQG
ncbi:MAG TPA: phasin family protein [Accumulibacter sp.]|uniref:phasin family protein n=1 Tax=Accumulibacter sp. TaxID=2053492 RepID=UPI0025FD1372|nr:phasin family protein [Accumulibacter sp.]MCM8600440.1 phasin family protein [Accumulibacter sp.]MCM8664630.1 phasin family protein [Accumulibacter sp.]HNC53332.1 phasin family protein [Accumulibacter sp.]